MDDTARRHLPQFDLLRGAAILAVVYLHAYFTPWPGVSDGGLTALRVAHLFAHGAVPLFLFMAAFLQATAGRESVVEHLCRRWWSTWFPAALWIVAAFAYRLTAEGASWGLVRDLALFDISGQFYFVWLLLVFGVALTQAWRVPSGAWPWLLAGAFTAHLATVALYEWHGGLDGLSATLAYRNPAVWVFFPMLGYRLGSLGLGEAPRAGVRLGSAIMAGAFAAYVTMGLARDHWPASYFGVTVFLFSCGGCLVYPAAAKVIASAAVVRPLIALSRYAFPIYLVHIPFVLGLGTHHLLGDGAAWSNYWLLLHANALIGFAVSLALVRELDKASPRLGARLLGVRRGKSRRTRNHAVQPSIR
jgi:peptidoglycan/LPS O-acetylase OafA/YrhL